MRLKNDEKEKGKQGQVEKRKRMPSYRSPSSKVKKLVETPKRRGTSSIHANLVGQNTLLGYLELNKPAQSRNSSNKKGDGQNTFYEPAADIILRKTGNMTTEACNATEHGAAQLQ